MDDLGAFPWIDNDKSSENAGDLRLKVGWISGQKVVEEARYIKCTMA